MTPAGSPAGVTQRTGAIAIVMGLVAAFFLSVNNTAQGFYYAAGGTVAAMLVVRYVAYVVLASLVLLASGRPLFGERKHLLRALGSGLIYACGMIGLLGSFVRMEISLAILTLYTFPILLMILDAVADRRLPPTMAMLAAFGAFAGLGLALEVWKADLALDGILYASAASVCFAANFFVNARWLAGVPTTQVTLHMKASGLILMLVYSAMLANPLPVEVNPTLVIAGAAAVIAYLIAYVAMFRGIESGKAALTAGMLNLEPLITLAMAAVFLAEPLNGARLAGAVVVVASVLLLQHALTRQNAVTS
ncbi:MAG: EamA family transporter [Rhizobiales bacterium]|nr:EamA family transporter [Hyphomicrobiales bacterium]